MPNPFFFAGKITNPEHFVGREKELKKIFSFLDTAHTGQIQHVSVVGQRRIGKSSLLFHVSKVYSAQLSDHRNYRFVYLDLDNPHCHKLSGLLRYILEKLNLSPPAQPTLERFYDLIEQDHERRKVWPVFLMDEFEHLPERATEFPDQFYDSLRSLGNNNIVGLVTGSQSKLQELASQGKLTSPFFNIFHQIDLKEFSDTEANVLLNRGRSSDHPFNDTDCTQILKIAGNHPARMQIVASLIYEAKANKQTLDWKAIKAEAQKEPPFNTNVSSRQNFYSRFITPFRWILVAAPKYAGHAILVVIGRGEHTNGATDWIVGFIALVVVTGVLLKVIPWSLVLYNISLPYMNKSL